MMSALMPRHTFQIARDMIRRNPQQPKLRIVNAEAGKKIGLQKDISRRVLNHILVKATEYDRQKRYQTASEMLSDVSELVLSLENKTAPFDDGFEERQVDLARFEPYVSDSRKLVFIYGCQDPEFPMNLEAALRQSGVNAIGASYRKTDNDPCASMILNMMMKPLYQKIDEEKDEMLIRINALNMYDCFIINGFESDQLTNVSMVGEPSFRKMLEDLDCGLIFISSRTGKDNPAAYGLLDEKHQDIVVYENGERQEIIRDNLSLLLGEADFSVMNEILAKKKLFRTLVYEDWLKEIASLIKQAKADNGDAAKLYKLLLALKAIHGESLACKESIEFSNYLFEKKYYGAWHSFNEEIYHLIEKENQVE